MIPSHRAPTHPGEMLLEEFLRPLGITQVEAARKMTIPLNRLNEIIRGRRGVTADTAIRLARLLGTSPEFWTNLQSSWDIYEAAKHLHISLEDVRGVIVEARNEPDVQVIRTKSLGHAWSAGSKPRIAVSEHGARVDVTSTAKKVCVAA